MTSYDTPSYYLDDEGGGTLLFDGRSVPFKIFRTYDFEGCPSAGDIFKRTGDADGDLWTAVLVESDENPFTTTTSRITIRAVRTSQLHTVETKLDPKPDWKGRPLC